MSDREAPGVTVHRGTRPIAPSAAGPATAADARPVPEATVTRLAIYLRVLTDMLAAGRVTVSSDELAASAGVNSATLRKDLSHIGSAGVRGVGYDVTRLIAQVEGTLGLTRTHAVALAGVGNLGHALAGYGGFSQRGFPVAALFDVDPALVGTTIAGTVVAHVDEIPRTCAERAVTIGVVATPAHAAQEVCDRMVSAGLRSILNFAPTLLAVPDGVEVRKVDLAVEMQVLSFHEARRHASVTAAPAETDAQRSGAGPSVADQPTTHTARRRRKAVRG